MQVSRAGRRGVVKNAVLRSAGGGRYMRKTRQKHVTDRHDEECHRWASLFSLPPIPPQIQAPAYPPVARAATTCSATHLKAADTGDSGILTTTGCPLSPLTAVAGSSGIAPSSGRPSS